MDEERNLLTMTGEAATIHRVVPPDVALLFRGQVTRLPPDRTTVTLRTACLGRGDDLLLPAGRVMPVQGVRVPRRQVAELPLDLDVCPVKFPDYAASLLSLPRTVSCLEQAGRILASLGLVPGQQGVTAVYTAMSDIYVAAMEAEERNPGVVFDRLFRAEKAVVNWFVGLGRNAYRTEYRRTRVGERGNQRGIFFTPFEDETRYRRNGYALLEYGGIESEQEESLFAGRLQGLALLPEPTRSVLEELGWVGPLEAARNLGLSREEVYAAIREARALLQAQELASSDLGELAADMRGAIRRVAEIGPSAAAGQLGRSADWLLEENRSGRMLETARDLLASSASAEVPLPAQSRVVLNAVVRWGLGQGTNASETGTAARSSPPPLSPPRSLPLPRETASDRDFAARWAQCHAGPATLLDRACGNCPYSCKHAWRDAALKVGSFCPILAQIGQIRSRGK